MKRIIMFFAAAAAVLTGCSKEDEMAVTPVNPESEIKTISEIVVGMDEDDGTRVYLGTGYQPVWEENDQITVWSDTGEKANFIYKGYVKDDNGQNTKACRFQAFPVQEIKGTRFYAVYPAVISANPQNSADKSSSITITLGNEQTYRADQVSGVATYDREAVPLAAQTTSVNSLNQAVFTFSNLCSLIAVNLSGAESVSVQGLKLEATLVNNVGLSGSARIAFPSGGGAPSLSVTSGREGRNTLTLGHLGDDGEGIMMGNTPKTFYFVVPANASVSKLKFTITAQNMTDYSDVSITKSRTYGSAAGKKFAAGTINDIGATFTLSGEAPKKYKVGDLYDVDGLTGVVFQVTNPDTQNSSLHGKIVAMTDTSVAAVWTTKTEDDLDRYFYDDRYFLSSTDGKSNMANADTEGINNFPAFKVCRDLAPVGEWYLPADGEWAAINNAAVTSALGRNGRISGNYWVSTLSSEAYPGYRALTSTATMSEYDLSKTYKVRAVAEF